MIWCVCHDANNDRRDLLVLLVVPSALLVILTATEA
jgi:hypothetical protein